MKINKLLLLLSVLMMSTAYSQVGINTDKPNTNSLLHVSEQLGTQPKTYKGIITPRYTTAERDANFSLTPAENGLLIYNTTQGCYNYWRETLPAYTEKNGVWINMCGVGATVFTLNCAGATLTGNGGSTGLQPTVGVTFTGEVKIPYLNGDGSSYPAGTSFNIDGLWFTLQAGTLNTTGGDITYAVTGTPSSSGSKSATFTISGQTCIFNYVVNPSTTPFALDCVNVNHYGNLEASSPAGAGVYFTIPYTGGDGTSYSAQTINSTGVTGLTASLAAGNFATGPGSLTYIITGTPIGSGIANFAINIKSQSCSVTRPIAALSVCDGVSTTTVVPITMGDGSTWMDRNLGATRAALSETDHLAYGCQYQWGRGNDGHANVQYSNATTANIMNGVTNTPSISDTPGHDLWISTFGFLTSQDWRDPGNNNLWQGVSGINNPCPAGYRIPTETELLSAFGGQTATGVFTSAKIPRNGRIQSNGAPYGDAGQTVVLWSSTTSLPHPTQPDVVYFARMFETQSLQQVNDRARSDGASVRCIRN